MHSSRRTKAGKLVEFYLRKGYKKARFQKADARAWKWMRKEAEECCMR